MDRSERPNENECSTYHRRYVDLVPEGDILETLRDQASQIESFVAEIDPAETEIVHPPYGWTIRQVLEHCADAERVFGYRALRFAAGDATELPGWDENAYADAGYGPDCSLKDIALEYVACREANVSLLARLTEDAWRQSGAADGKSVSVRALAWLMAGHWLHHEAILKQRLQLA